MGLRPDLLRQVVQERVVVDADDSPPECRHERRFTDTPPGRALWSFHATLRARSCKLQLGAFSPVVGVLPWPAPGRKPLQPARKQPVCGLSYPVKREGRCKRYETVLRAFSLRYVSSGPDK